MTKNCSCQSQSAATLEGALKTARLAVRSARALKCTHTSKEQAKVILISIKKIQ